MQYPGGPLEGAGHIKDKAPLREGVLNRRIPFCRPPELLVEDGFKALSFGYGRASLKFEFDLARGPEDKSTPIELLSDKSHMSKQR